MKLYNLVKIAIKLQLPKIKFENIVEDYEHPLHFAVHKKHIDEEKKAKKNDNISRPKL